MNYLKSTSPPGGALMMSAGQTVDVNHRALDTPCEEAINQKPTLCPAVRIARQPIPWWPRRPAPSDTMMPATPPFPANSVLTDILLPVFQVLPGALLLLSPALLIEAVSDGFLTETLTHRADMIGRYLFDVFPDNPAAAPAQGLSTLHASLLQVLTTGRAHELPRQRYEVPDPAHPGRFVERHWQPCNTPVLDAQGRVTHILHDAVNVTERVRGEDRLRASEDRTQTAQADADAQRLHLHDILLALPINVMALHGPTHVVRFVNPRFQAMFPTRELLGRPVRETLPELAGQGFFQIFDGVYQTGESFYDPEMEMQADFSYSGQLERRY